MSLDPSVYGDYEIAAKMIEEHDRKDQVSVEVKKKLKKFDVWTSH